MRFQYSEKFRRNFKKFSVEIQNKFDKQAGFLLANPRHPSLQIKKYGGVDNVWQVRVNRSVRFYFYIEKDAYILLDICKHPD